MRPEKDFLTTKSMNYLRICNIKLTIVLSKVGAYGPYDTDNLKQGVNMSPLIKYAPDKILNRMFLPMMKIFYMGPPPTLIKIFNFYC